MVDMMGKSEWRAAVTVAVEGCQGSGARNDKNGEKETADEKGL
jgi:hypothetical protein